MRVCPTVPRRVHLTMFTLSIIAALACVSLTASLVWMWCFEDTVMGGIGPFVVCTAVPAIAFVMGMVANAAASNLLRYR